MTHYQPAQRGPGVRPPAAAVHRGRRPHRYDQPRSRVARRPHGADQRRPRRPFPQPPPPTSRPAAAARRRCVPTVNPVHMEIAGDHDRWPVLRHRRGRGSHFALASATSVDPRGVRGSQEHRSATTTPSPGRPDHGMRGVRHPPTPQGLPHTDPGQPGPRAVGIGRASWSSSLRSTFTKRGPTR